ncbi:hypothetical protein [Flavobacterium sp.]|jgi:hypothetical protein|uniref:hypothetical protein n=1 Tax=Flavobacterium sp. TaxID=239 RepID=UPI0025BBD13C|nr:hypothetical protein [Flavobacterium sp.]
MSRKNDNSNRLIIFFLSLLIVVLFFKDYKDTISSNKIQNSLKEENYIAQSQLSEMIEKYDSVLIKLNSNKYSAGANRNQNNVDFNNLSGKSFSSIDEQITAVKDSIFRLKNRLRRLQTESRLTQRERKNQESIEKISSASKLIVSNLQARGVKFIKDNSTNAQKKEIEQIRVCFSFEGNQIVDYGNKELFVQIVNPKNEIVSKDNLVFEQNNTTLRYSKKVDFLYNKQITDVCTYVDLEKNKIYKGRYLVNLYSGTKKIGSTIFSYN